MWRIQIQNMYLKGENTGLINGKYAKKVKCSYLQGRSTVWKEFTDCARHSSILYFCIYKKMLLNLIRTAQEINVDRAKPQCKCIQVTNPLNYDENKNKWHELVCFC